MGAIEILSVIIAVFAIIITYFKWKFAYWSKIGVPTLEESLKIPFGHCKDLILGRRGYTDVFTSLYQEARQKNLKYVGLYMMAGEFLMAIDPELIKLILVKDFQHFVNHGLYFNEEVDPLSGHLFHLEDEKWKKMRVKLTPTFTSGKMKMMFEIFAECANNLEEVFGEISNSDSPVNVKKILRRFSKDIIGSAAFGIESNNLRDPDGDFNKYLEKIFEVTFLDRLKIICTMIFPSKFLKLIKLKMMKPDIEKFFLDLVRKTVEYREENNFQRKDFMQLLIDVKNQKNGEEDGLSLNELAAQASVFFFGGFETSSTLMNFALYELCENVEIQENLRKEIREVLARHGGKINYESLHEMSLLDKVVHETLRKYPPITMFNRICTKDYTIPESNVNISKGTFVGIPVYGIHYDEEYYPNPEKFDPERFSEENKNARPPCTWLPFGEGPRVCIGSRFGLMQSKIGLATILSKFRVSISEKTQRPLKMKKNNPFLEFENILWLDVVRAN